MRFKSDPIGGFQVFAVTGTNTVSFAITASDAALPGLLGFAVEREGAGQPRRMMPGFKVFRSIIPNPDRHTRVSTADHPVQSLVWDDFTGEPDREYTYWFHPLRGTPTALDRTAAPIPIKVKTEALYSTLEHDIFFNRGVASSQAYARKFENKKPSELPPDKAKEALQWLTRDLDDAILKFIGSATNQDSLLCCFYEFRYDKVLAALQTAIANGVDVRIIVDAKDNGRPARNGEPPQEAFPRVANLEAIAKAGIPLARVILRDANPSDIQHNKFIVLLKGADRVPAEVWTGSTNISESGFTGQTNVGHWVRNAAVAASYKAYWDLVATNPGSRKGDTNADARKSKTAQRQAVGKLGKVPTTIQDITPGVTTVFSPRAGLKVLDLYVALTDSAQQASCVTLAFGVNKLFKQHLLDNTPNNHLVFLLLEKKDRPNKRSKDPFVAINASNNVYKAWGSYIDDPVYNWVHETNARALALSNHVAYVHSKFLLMDPLGADPIVVTGSANFSPPSTNANDENMLIIRGDRRVADIYFTEFNRLFNHYYFRAVHEERERRAPDDVERNLFLDETGTEWVKKYEPGNLRAKRLALYAAMEGFTAL